MNTINKKPRAKAQPERVMIFHQMIDGEYKYDPLAGARDGFGRFTVWLRVQEIVDWAAANATGMVCLSWWKTRQPYKRDWTSSEVLFEFQNPADAVRAKLTFGGAA